VSPAPALTLPVWFQVLLGVIAILSFVGGAWFALFIIWPSIRRQTKLGDRIDELINKAHKKLESGVDGKVTTLDDFVGPRSGSSL
jgi:uncharacterized membrane protein